MHSPKALEEAVAAQWPWFQRRLRELVEDHWAVLKVGPALTFAMREALFALSLIETELVPRPSRSNLVEVIERRMLDEPDYWRGYYEGDPVTQRTSRRYSYSDRLRYYWRFPEVEAAVARLIRNLQRREIPETLLSQHCPRQYDEVRAGRLRNDPKELVIASVRTVLGVYSRACRGDISVLP